MKNKDFKILIIGFGSIGQRHFKNLTTLGYKNVYIYDSDKSKISDLKFQISDLSQKNLKQFDIALICNPNNKHIETALKCAEAGPHLFIEKPLSHNLKDIEKLEKICQEKKLVNMVACNMRFHPSLEFIKKYLEGGKLGKVYSISHEFGHYLPLWRPGTDYTKNYAAKKSTGGGIVLDDIHEFDLLFWLNDFSEVKKCLILKENSGTLKIETEDQAKGIFQFKNGVLGSVSSDYLSKTYRRNCLITGEKGNLSWNWRENKIIFENENGREVVFEKGQTDTNEMYLEEIKYFLKNVEEKSETFNNVRRARKILEYLVK